MLHACLVFENGTTGFLHNLNADAFSLFEMDIIGTLGRVRLIDSGHRIEYFHVCESNYYSGYKTIQKTHEQNGVLENTILNTVTDLIHCLRKGRQPQCSGTEGFAALYVASAIIESARKNLM